MAQTVILRPSSDGSVAHSKSSGSSGYLLVNESTSDGDASYIYQSLGSTSTATQSSTFNFAHSIPNGARITSVVMHVNARNAGNGETSSFTGSVSVAGVSYATFASTSLSSSYTDRSASAAVNASVGAITATLTSSGHMSSSKGASAGYIRITQIYLEVTYEKSELPDFSVSIASWKYTHTPSTPTVSGNLGGGAVSIAYKLWEEPDSAYSSIVPTEVGEYTVRAVVAETEGYLGATATANFAIAPRDLYVQINGEPVLVQCIYVHTGSGGRSTWEEILGDPAELFQGKNLKWISTD